MLVDWLFATSEGTLAVSTACFGLYAVLVMLVHAGREGAQLCCDAHGHDRENKGRQLHADTRLKHGSARTTQCTFLNETCAKYGLFCSATCSQPGMSLPRFHGGVVAEHALE